jgi:hypothetical protein
MNQAEFERALLSAIQAPARSGIKWKRLERLFAAEGVRGSGALNNDPAERRTRIRQILTARTHAGFETAGHSRHGILLLNADAAQHAEARGDEFVHGSIVRDIDAEVGAGAVIESVLVMRHDGNGVMVPLVLMVWRNGPILDSYREWYADLTIVERERPAAPAANVDGIAVPQAELEEGAAQAEPGKNIIFFGPPGVGKSYLVSTETEDFASVLRTVFHPEYSHGDFAGLYKPVTGKDATEEIISYDSERMIARPIVYYDFESGIFTRALIAAHGHPGQSVALVIEEINRGDCAAIFGDFFQLLDRNESGRSQYGIRVNAAMGRFLASAGVIDDYDHEVFLPSNLWIFATMNTADQSLYPMDAAFKRRWHWRAVPITAGEELLGEVTIANPNDPHPVRWLDLIHAINQRVLSIVKNEDKRVGPWYLEATSGVIEAGQVRDKLLFYLWHDVFRSQRSAMFASTLTTFDAVQEAFEAGGIRDVLPTLIPVPAPAVAAAPIDVGERVAD